MSPLVGILRKVRSARGLSDDCELNIVSIVDCFTVLILYLLTAASVVALGGLRTGLAAPGSGPSAPDAPTTVVSVQLRGGRQIDVLVDGPEPRTISIPPVSGRWDFAAAVQAAEAARAPLSGSGASQPLLLFAEDEVRYDDIIAAAGVLRRKFPIALATGGAS